MRYFYKAIVENTIIGPNNVNVPFIPYGSGEGALETEDEALIACLLDRIANRRGGVAEMTKEQYEELKKKPNVSHLRRLARDHQFPPSFPIPSESAAAVQGEPEPQPEPEPVVVPSEPLPPPVESRPTTSKRRSQK